MDRELRIELMTYSVRCTICNRHIALYEHPNDKKLYCRKHLSQGDLNGG